MTIQDLKNNREAIIEFATERELNVKEFMSFLVEAVEIGLNTTEDVMDFVYDSWYHTFAPRSRKTSKVAESRAKAEFEGRMDSFDIKKYYANK